MNEKEFALDCGEAKAEKLSMYTISDLLSATINKLHEVKDNSETLVADLCLGKLSHSCHLNGVTNFSNDKNENLDANLVTEFYNKLQDINIAIELIQKDILYSNSLVK